MNRLRTTNNRLHIRQVPVSRYLDFRGFPQSLQRSRDHVRFQLSHPPTNRRYKNHSSQDAGTQRVKHAVLLRAGDNGWFIKLILSCSMSLVRTLLDINDISGVDYILIFKRCYHTDELYLYFTLREVQAVGREPETI
jgi:hypothetical protein